MRKGLAAGNADSAANQAKFDFLVDEVIPKIATTDAWGPNYRHTTIMLEAQQDVPEGKDPVLCVTPSDLAYLHSYYVSYGAELDWEIKKHLGTLATFPDDHEVEAARGNASCEGTDAQGKTKTIYFEARPAPVHCKAEGGRCPYGGWLKAGITEYKDRKKELEDIYEADSRNPNLKRIKKADTECLARLRTKHDREAVEQKRANRRKGSGATAVVDSDEGEDF